MPKAREGESMKGGENERGISPSRNGGGGGSGSPLRNFFNYRRLYVRLMHFGSFCGAEFQSFKVKKFTT